MRNHTSLPMHEDSQVGDARRVGVRLATQAGMDEHHSGKVAIVVTELARNLVKHGKHGELLICAIEGPGVCGLEAIALDKGPGMHSVAECMRDGFSTAGTPGTGLGAIQRMADLMDVYSVPKHGTVILAQVLQKQGHSDHHARFELGAVNVPIKGETICGDAWNASQKEGRLLAAVADGLGHGPDAAHAAQEAMRVFNECERLRPSEILEEMNGVLRSTRGAAVSILELRLGEPELRFAGVGNVSGMVFRGGTVRNMVSHSGTLGHAFHHWHEFAYPWSSDSLLVMHSDGLTSQWDPRKYPGLLMKHPTTIAAVIYRDHKRGRDDATVLVARQRNSQG